MKIALAEQNKKTYAKSVSFEIDGSTIEVIPNYDEEYTMDMPAAQISIGKQRLKLLQKKIISFTHIILDY
nr:hypothetical protein [Klebsiella pneumoniae]